MKNREVIIEARGLTKVYGRGHGAVHAVNGVGLEVRSGERIYVHGHSGAGKSTLLHILGGLDTPTSGEVIFRGRNLYRGMDRSRSRLRRECFGFVFQFYHLLPELNVLENVMMPARMSSFLGTSGARLRAEMLLERVGMAQRRTHRPSQLSGGESQRTALARALMNSPEVLFCDEPTGNLDSEMSEEIYRLITEISSAENMSVVLVSHQEVPDKFPDREYLMKDGKMEAAGNGVAAAF